MATTQYPIYLQIIAFLILAPMAWAGLMLVGRGMDRLIDLCRVRAEARRGRH